MKLTDEQQAELKAMADEKINQLRHYFLPGEGGKPPTFDENSDEKGFNDLLMKLPRETETVAAIATLGEMIEEVGRKDNPFVDLKGDEKKFWSTHGRGFLVEVGVYLRDIDPKAYAENDRVTADLKLPEPVGGSPAGPAP